MYSPGNGGGQEHQGTFIAHTSAQLLPWQFEGGAGWEANRHLLVTAALGVFTAHHIFWFLLLFLPPDSKNLTQKRIYFSFIFCEKIKQSTLTV